MQCWGFRGEGGRAVFVRERVATVDGWKARGLAPVALSLFLFRESTCGNFYLAITHGAGQADEAPFDPAAVHRHPQPLAARLLNLDATEGVCGRHCRDSEPRSEK